MITRFAFFVLLFLASHNAQARADYVDYKFHLKCDSTSDRVEIIPYTIPNQDVYSPEPKDCVLDSGRSVRVKLVVGQVYPYGQRGPASKLISVWVDKALVLRRVGFDCDNNGSCNLRIIVTASGLKVCRPSPSSSEENCDFIPNEELEGRRDALEFPLPSERKRPKAGSFVTLYAKDEEFCRGFDKVSGKLHLPDGFDEISPEAPAPSEYNGGYRRYRFDINNDGQADAVVRQHTKSNYRLGDLYFVYPDGNLPTPVFEFAKKDEVQLEYAEHAKWILPPYWSDTGSGRNLDEGSYLVKSGSPWWDINDNAIFNMRYWLLSPYRYENVTYFTSETASPSTDHWFVILKSEPNFDVTEMCVFQTVRVRH